MDLRKACCLLLMGLLTACSQSAPSPTPTATIQLFTPVALSSTPTSAHGGVLSTPTLIPTTAPFSPFKISPAVDGVRLRVGPGALFAPLLLLNMTDTLSVQAQAPGGDWIYVETIDGTRGWIFAQLLEQHPALSSAPVVKPENVQEVRGRLLDVSGVPISGVVFSLTRGTNERTDATTDANGEFHAFLPADVTGDWSVSYEAIGCTSNAFLDSSCSGYKPGYTGTVQPGSQPVTLPAKDVLSFEWR